MRKTYDKLQEELKNNILRGHLSSGTPVPTEAELSRQYGISRNSVRRALDNLVKEGLLRKVKGVGSFVIPPEERPGDSPENQLARRQILFLSFASAASERTFFNDDSYLPKVNGVNRVLLPRDFNLLFSHVGLDWTPPPCLVNNDINGVIFYGPVQHEFWEKYIAPHPNVGIQFIDPELPCSWAKPDYETLGQLSVAHLHALGHRRIGFVTNEAEMQYSIDRMNGYLLGMTRRNLAVPEEYLIAMQRQSCDGVLMVEDLLQDYSPYLEKAFSGKTEPPTALICMDDWRAFRTIKALEKIGLRVPEDVSVMGSFGEIRHSGEFGREITGFSCRMEDVCAEAASLLLKQMTEGREDLFRTVTIRPEFFPGDTTAPVKK